MSDPSPEELVEAARWLREASEELELAYLITQHEVPARAACFHAHLAAEKAIKALMIRRGVVVRKSHDLPGLADELPPFDRDSLVLSDLKLLNPWTLEGRYPEDLADLAASRVAPVVEAARRVIESVAAAFGSTVDGGDE